MVFLVDDDDDVFFELLLAVDFEPVCNTVMSLNVLTSVIFQLTESLKLEIHIISQLNLKAKAAKTKEGTETGMAITKNETEQQKYNLKNELANPN